MTETEMRRQIQELTWERDALLKQIAGDPSHSLFFYQRKTGRQRTALDQLNRRNSSLRFALRLHERIHGSLTQEEYQKARVEVENEQLRDRLDENPPKAE
jgi:hypothetical protein